jgi:molybdopterin synthase sulfur carrier subunit
LPTAYIPTLLQTLTGGKSSVEVLGATVRQVIENLELTWPGIGERLLDQGRLRPNISVAVDGEVTPMGLLEPVGPSSEVHFIAAIKGGSDPRGIVPVGGTVMHIPHAVYPAPDRSGHAKMR